MALTEAQQSVLDRLHDRFETHGGVLQLDALSDDEWEDVRALWIAGEVVVHPPGHLVNADYVTPSPKSRPRP